MDGVAEMNYHDRQEIINKYNNGNSVNGDAPEVYYPPEDECPDCGELGDKYYIKRNGICEDCFHKEYKEGR